MDFIPIISPYPSIPIFGAIHPPYTYVKTLDMSVKRWYASCKMIGAGNGAKIVLGDFATEVEADAICELHRLSVCQ